jgi:hypothetical protein
MNVLKYAPSILVHHNQYLSTLFQIGKNCSNFNNGIPDFCENVVGSHNSESGHYHLGWYAV